MSVGIHEENLEKKPNDLQALFDELSDMRCPDVVFMSKKIPNEEEKCQGDNNATDTKTDADEKMDWESSD